MAALTELKLRTDFILDRTKFLDDVCAAIHKEDTVRSQDMLNLILRNDYPLIIARLMVDPNMAVRVQAIWTMANLLGADRTDVRSAANRACLGMTTQIFDNLIGAPDADVQRSTAYLLFNWLRRFRKNDEVDEQVLRLLDTGFIRTVIKKASVRADLLGAVRAALRRTQAGGKAAREVVRLLTDATSKQERAPLMEMFSEICEEEKGGFAEADHAVVFDLFEKLFCREDQRLEATWALSNFICDGDLADKFFTRWDLRREMVEQCESADEHLRAEAGWVLTNAIARAEWESTHADVGTDYGLRYALCSVGAGLPDNSGMIYTAIHEALDKLSHWEALYAPLEESEDESDEDTITEIVEEDEIVPGLTAAQICEMAGVYENLPCEVPAPVLHMAEEPLPSAFELMVDHKNRNGSAALRGLVFSLKNAGCAANIPVPAGTVLSIEDLTLMGSLGYMISQGCFSINPYLTMVRYF
jgi:hypothetical protein